MHAHRLGGEPLSQSLAARKHPFFQNSCPTLSSAARRQSRVRSSPTPLGDVARGVSDKLVDTLLSIDALVGSAGAASEAIPAEQGSGEGQDATVSQETDATPTPAVQTAAAPTQRSLAALDPIALLEAAFKMGKDALRDYFKPTSIVDKADTDLPRAVPRLSYVMLVANMAVYAIGLSFIFSEGQDGPTDFFLSLANVDDAIEAGEYYSYALLTFAPEAEAVLGSFTFASTYILSGVAGSVLCFLLTDTLTVGASSGIFGLIGALGAFLYKNHKVPNTSEQLLFAAAAVFFNLFLGGKSESAIDNLGHLGGLLCGIYLGILLTPAVLTEPASGPGDSQIALAERPSTEEADLRARVIRPNPWQSACVLLCVSVTLCSGVAAGVLQRTGELPPLRLPPWLS